ncbi:MAG: hypothetical protein QME40_06655 [bacterium]|nr:hypothetical protein [bacterium]
MKENVDRTFAIIELMEDLRDIWRETSPTHTLSPEQKEKVLSIILDANKILKRMEEAIYD